MIDVAEGTQVASFFELMFGSAQGWVNVARRNQSHPLERRFYQWPDEKSEMVSWLEKYAPTYDLYYCPHLFIRGKGSRPEKGNVGHCRALWADLDECPPDRLLRPPTVLLRTSAGRWQALWLLAAPADPDLVEELSRRIVYAHRADGADVGGWNLAKLLRVPFTYNHKHHPKTFIDTWIKNITYELEDFSIYPSVEISKLPMPQTDGLDLDALVAKIPLDVMDLYLEEPREHQWSTASWNLVRSLIENDIPIQEAFYIMEHAACNKYKRDNRKREDLWKEVVKAYERQTIVDMQHKMDRIRGPITNSFPIPDLLTEKQRQIAEEQDSIIKRYVNWASEQTDACPLYHHAGGFMILSTLLSSTVRLPTSFGTIAPNLWFLILADSTISRKSTAMDMATDLTYDVDEGFLLANDGSLEGLMASLAGRSGRASVFVRDEFSGLLNSMAHKEYYSGMSEAFARLYDGKRFERVLRREVIHIEEPVFLIFGGGAKTKIMDTLTHEHVTSGFIPRFVFICGEADPSKVRPIGPPTSENDTERNTLVKELTKMYEFYHQEITQTVNNITLVQNRIFKAELTPETWILYNESERRLTTYASNHPLSAVLLTPTLDRLAKSALKCAVLIAASREYQDNVTVMIEDLILALWYVEQWAPYSLEVISKIGQGTDERRIMAVYEAISQNGPMQQSFIMQQQRLMNRQAREVFETLEQRGLLKRDRGGRDPLWMLNE